MFVSLRRRSAPCRLYRAIHIGMELLESRVLLSGASVQLSAPNPVQGAGEFEIDATLTDASAINTAGVAPSNIVVSGPFGDLKVLGDEVSSSAGGTTVGVGYFVQSPGGIWDADANGNYSVAFQPGQVSDAAGQTAAGASIGFAASGLTPLTGAVAVAFEPADDGDITVPGTTGKTLEVTYSDPAGINLSTINSGNLDSFESPLIVTLESTNVLDNGTVVDATYFMGAPGGAFYASADTGYHVVINPDDAVTNTAGVPVSSAPYSIIALYEVLINPFDSSFTFSGSSASGFVAQAIGHQSNGDIILAGVEGDTSAGNGQLVVERLLSDGTVDPTFGTDGVFTGAAGSNQAAFGLTVESDDSILLAGTSNNDFLLAHLTSNGALDTNFGTAHSGEVTTATDEFSSAESAYSVATLPDGTIVAAGGSDGTWAFAHYSATGADLNAFEIPLSSSTGPANPTAPEGEVGRIAVEADGSIVAAGSDGGNVAVAEVDASGTLVPGFNSGQIEVLPDLAAQTGLSSGLDHSIGMALDDTGRIVVANRTTGSSPTFAIERLNTDGTSDDTFGPDANGVVTADFNGNGDDDADSVAIQPGGQIVVTGTTTDSSGDVETAIATFNEDGSVNDGSLLNGTDAFDPRINISALTPAGVIRPDLGAAGAALTEAFGDASGNTVTVGSAERTSSGGGTGAQSLNLPGIVSTVSANPLATSASTYSFSVAYADNSQLDAAALQSTGAVSVTPATTATTRGGITPAAASSLKVVGAVTNGSTVTYSVAGPSGTWTSSDDGTYEIELNGKVITDKHGNHAPAGTIGNFTVAIPSATGLSISGTVFNDQNDSGTQDAGESGVPGVVVYADENGSGNPVSQPQAITDASGNYTIGGLTGNQTYPIREVLPTGYSQTFPDSDADQAVSLTNSSVSGESFGIVLGAAPGSLSGEVYDGLTGTPQSGVTVFVDSNQNGVLDAGETSATTDGAGNYRLSNLAAGIFSIVEIPPASQTASATSVTTSVTSGAAAGPSFADVPSGVPSGVLAANLTGAFVTSPPASVISGSKGKLTLRINNTGSASATGTIKVTLFASTSQTLVNATRIIDVPVRLKLKPNGATSVKLNFTYPSGLVNGKYSMIASIDSGDVIAETTKADNLAVSNPLTIAAAFVSLNGTLNAPATITPGKTVPITLNLSNQGNSAASGTSRIQIFASSDQTLDGSDVQIGSFPARFNIKQLRNGVFRLKLKLNGSQLPPGSYYLIATIGAAGLIPATTVAATAQTAVI